MTTDFQYTHTNLQLWHSGRHTYRIPVSLQGKSCCSCTHEADPPGEGIPDVILPVALDQKAQIKRNIEIWEKMLHGGYSFQYCYIS